MPTDLAELLRRADQADPLLTRDPLLTGVFFPPQVVDEVTEFTKALTDPSARTLQHIIPQRVPSLLPVDGALGGSGS